MNAAKISLGQIGIASFPKLMLVCWAIWICGALTPCRSDVPTPPSAVSIDAHDPRGAAAFFNVGRLYSAGDPAITHGFLLKNNGSAPVTITDLKASCGCTRAWIEDKASAGLPATLAPGQARLLQVSVDPADLVPGVFDKSVAVFASQTPSPAVTLHIIGNVQPAIRFSSPVVDFGEVSAYAPAVVNVEADAVTDADAALLSAGKLELVCSDPDVRSSLVMVPEPRRNLPADGAASPTPQNLPAEHVVLRFMLSPSAILGMLTGSAAVTLKSSGPGPRPVLGVLPITGEVVGGLSASPAVVFFNGSRQSTQRVVITANGADAPKGLTIISTDPNISTHLSYPPTDPQEISDDSEAFLDVSINNPASSPPQEIPIIVDDAKGEKLRIPVFLSISKPGTTGPITTVHAGKDKR